MKLELVLVTVWLGVCLCAPQRGAGAVRAPKAPAAAADTATALAAAPRDNRASRTSRQDNYRGDTRYADDVLRYYQNDYFGPGRYKFAYTLRDSFRKEESELRNEGRDDEYIVVRGSYGYQTPDNRYIIVKYVADEQGYQPTIEEGTGGLPQPTPPPPLGCPFHLFATLCG